jgi:hypothetical protein
MNGRQPDLWRRRAAAAMMMCATVVVGDDDLSPLATRSEALAGPPSALGGYLLLARQSIAVGDRSVISGGSVGVAAASVGCPAGVLNAGASTTISVGNNVRAQTASPRTAR